MNSEQFYHHLLHFRLAGGSSKTVTTEFKTGNQSCPVFVNEFWTARQRQANAIHEVSYRACFKPQLPRFFIELFTKPNDTVYDPFNGRGTTVVEAALMERNIVANDVNPLSLILSQPRIAVPLLSDIEGKLDQIPLHPKLRADVDLSMFFHPDTESEIVSIRNYLITRKSQGVEDDTDRWIRMVATNRLTGHSKGFFSVYTLPPNQAVTAERQLKINRDRKQQPEYRNAKNLIARKSKALLKDYAISQTKVHARFLNCDASETSTIKADSISLTVTSPPFLDVVQYAADNWLRCWFNDIDMAVVSKRITMSKTVEDWSSKMQRVFCELFRITRPNGIVAFEVGEVRNGKVRLEEVVVPLGLHAGFSCEAILINEQAFTKTANIWGVSNNKSGTNSNRIVVFRKGALL